MSNEEKLQRAIVEGLQIRPDAISDDLAYSEAKEWDSVAHMTLVAAIEEEFDIMLDTDDIVDMSSVGKIKEILAKYNVKF